MIVLTGANGFLGAHVLCKLVASGKKVRAIKREDSNLDFVKSVFDRFGNLSDFEKVEWVNADVLDYFSLEDAFEGAQTVIHTAAMVSFGKKNRKSMYQINVLGTAHVVNACLYRKVGTLIHFSSIAALGSSDFSMPVNETSPWKNSPDTSWYARSKQAAESEVWRGVEEGLNALVLNPGVILGYADWNKSSGRIFTRARKGIPGYTTGTNGFVDVQDVVNISMALLDSPIRNERFILVSESLPFKRILELICNEIRAKTPSRSIPEKAMYALANLNEIWSSFSGKEPALTKDLVKSLYKITHYDNSKIKNAISFEFKSVEKSIHETALYFLQEEKK